MAQAITVNQTRIAWLNLSATGWFPVGFGLKLSFDKNRFPNDVLWSGWTYRHLSTSRFCKLITETLGFTFRLTGLTDSKF